MSKNIIIVLSLGNRSWVGLAYQTVTLYAEAHGVDCALIQEDCFDEFVLGPFRKGVGRQNKRAYALKSYIPWYYITRLGYDRVLMVDDTCVFSPFTKEIFSLAPADSLCFTTTAKSHAEETFEAIRQFAPGFPADQFNPEHYGNSGLVVYSSAFIEAFSPDKIVQAQDLLHARFPHQTLLYYLAKNADVPISIIPKQYNMIPTGFNKERQDRKDWIALPESIKPKKHFVLHFSNAFRHREQLIMNAASVYLRAWSRAKGRPELIDSLRTSKTVRS